jgi:hypothetical protein
MRDAIHVATISVIASCHLKPGQHVSHKDGYACLDGEPVGIVDPFRRTYVEEGESFTLMLYPGSVTSLRHHWTHPSFDNESKIWLEKFAKELDMSYESLILGLTRFCQSGERIFRPFDLPDIYYQEREELFRHFNAVTGIPVPDEKYAFTCAC